MPQNEQMKNFLREGGPQIQETYKQGKLNYNFSSVFLSVNQQNSSLCIQIKLNLLIVSQKFAY